MATTVELLTAEQYAQLPDTGRPTELYRGEVREMNPPDVRHGYVCAQTAHLLRNFLDPRQLGRIVSNDAGIITTRNPDTVRGGDVAFYSFRRVPPGDLPRGYVNVSPDVVFEVLSPSDRWSDVLLKVGEYLHVGVQTVVVLDPDAESAQVFYPDRRTIALSAADELHLAAIAEDCRFRVRQFFE